jgi:hypothetical protein
MKQDYDRPWPRERAVRLFPKLSNVRTFSSCKRKLSVDGRGIKSRKASDETLEPTTSLHRELNLIPYDSVTRGPRTGSSISVSRGPVRNHKRLSVRKLRKMLFTTTNKESLRREYRIRYIGNIKASNLSQPSEVSESISSLCRLRSLPFLSRLRKFLSLCRPRCLRCLTCLRFLLRPPSFRCLRCLLPIRWGSVRCLGISYFKYSSFFPPLPT